jgi:hypothetical protein
MKRVKGEAKRLTNSQGRFLRRLAGSKAANVLGVMDEVKLPRHWLEEWLTQPLFKRELKKRLMGMRRLREMDIKRGAVEAARRLSRAAFGAGDFTRMNLYERRACVDLVQLVRSEERKPRVPPVVEAVMGPGVHPEWGEEEGEKLLERLMEEGEKAGGEGEGA